MEPILLIVPLIILVLVFRLVAGSFDGDRVEMYVREQGWELVDKSWDPFGPGWFGEKNARIYQIVYKDQRGALHRAHVKTSMLSGVYLTRDCIVQEPSPSTVKTGHLSLKDENEQLRQRINELERNQP